MERNVNPATIQDARGFERVKLVEDAVAALVVNDDTRRGYLSRAGYVDNAVQISVAGYRRQRVRPGLQGVSGDRRQDPFGDSAVDIAEVMAEIEALLDQSIGAEGYVMPPCGRPKPVRRFEPD
jgi:type I restriction enzyme, R subunit